MKKSGWSRQDAWAATGGVVIGALVITGLYSGCGSDFFGSSPKPRRKAPQTVSPPEKESPRVPDTASNPNTGRGTGPATGTVVKDNAIQLTIVQTPSESWWKNCLQARTQVSNGWTPVACNKEAGATGKTVNLPGLEGQCNSIELRVDTFKNMGNACQPGQPCNGPYPSAPDFSRLPQTDPVHFQIYGAETIRQPDPLIRPNASWPLPDFNQLADQMAAYRGAGKANQWLRVFFEDQSAARISGVRDGRLNAQASGIDFNDYVFDIKGENIRFTIEGHAAHGSGAGSDCP